MLLVQSGTIGMTNDARKITSMYLRLLIGRFLLAFPGAVLWMVSVRLLGVSRYGTPPFTLWMALHLLSLILCVAGFCFPGWWRHRSRAVAGAPTGVVGQEGTPVERIAQFHPGTQTVRLLYGLLLFGLFCYFLVSGGVLVRNLALLRLYGVTTSCTILGTSYRENRPDMAVTYSFTIPGGLPITDSFIVPRARIGAMRTGNRLAIIYVRFRPDIHTPPLQKGDNALMIHPLLVGLLLFATVMAYLMFPIGVIEGRLRRQLRLARRGVLATGTIVACKPLIWRNRRRGYWLTYTYPLPSGEAGMARRLVHTVSGEPTLPGFPITILIDPTLPDLQRPLATFYAVSIPTLRRGVLVE